MFPCNYLFFLFLEFNWIPLICHNCAILLHFFFCGSYIPEFTSFFCYHINDLILCCTIMCCHDCFLIWVWLQPTEGSCHHVQCPFLMLTSLVCATRYRSWLWVPLMSPQGAKATQPLTASRPKAVGGGWSWFSSLGSMAVSKVYTQVQAVMHTHTHAHCSTLSFRWSHALFLRLLLAAPVHVHALGGPPNTAMVATCCNYYQMDWRETCSSRGLSLVLALFWHLEVG